MKIDFIKTPNPIGNFLNINYSGNLAFISGQGAFDKKGNLIVGKVGKDLTLEDGYQAARSVAVSILSLINNEIGFDKLEKFIKILGFVNCTKNFIDQPKVINGCSDLLIEYLGNKGKHARSAVGVYILPNNIPVEIEAIIQIKN